MTGPPWVAALLAAVMLLIAAGSLARLAVWRLHRRAAEPEADALHVLMGASMAGMFEPRISPVPSTAWLAVFAAAAAWFGWRAVRTRGDKLHAGGRQPGPGGWRCAHPAPHGVECAAMVYMLAPARGAGHGPAMAMPGVASAAANPAVALVLALFMLGYIVWTADRMTSQSRASAVQAGRRPACGAEPGVHQATHAARAISGALGPRAAACSKMAMSVTMGYMLLTML